jgi:hypothetical protein
MSDQTAHIVNIILYISASVAFGIGILSAISILIKVLRGKMKFVPAKRYIGEEDPLKGIKEFDDAMFSDPSFNLSSSNSFNSFFSSFDDD